MVTSWETPERAETSLSALAADEDEESDEPEVPDMPAESLEPEASVDSPESPPSTEPDSVPDSPSSYPPSVPSSVPSSVAAGAGQRVAVLLAGRRALEGEDSSQSSTQKTLCLTSEPLLRGVLIVSLTW